MNKPALSFEEIMTGEIKNDVREQEKPTLIFWTDFSLSVTGFGKINRYLSEYLHKTGKYKIVNLAMGVMAGNPDLDRCPWDTEGCVHPEKLQAIKNQHPPHAHPEIDRVAGYGGYTIDEVVKKYKPKAVFGIQDIWAVDTMFQYPWASKIPCIVSVTLDSLPIIPSAVEAAKKTPYFWIWADFATQAMKKIKGCEHVKTVRGPIDTSLFYKLPETKKKELKAKFGLTDNFVIGFVARNQLRKSFPQLLQGFKMFKDNNPLVKAKLLLHTCFTEGWNIHRLAEEHSIDKNDILTTYVCRNCQEYEVKPFVGPEVDCKFCRAPKGQVTTQPSIGVTDQGLCEIFNLMDVYCHPFTSGGQEIPIQQAKLAELITLVTNYSCGEDSCQPEAHSLPLEWAEYREPGTEFIKATTYPFSIAKQLKKVYEMNPSKRAEMGKGGRQWVLDNFSIEKIGKIWEDFIDNLPPHNYNFNEKPQLLNPSYIPSGNPNEEEWVEELYKNILLRDSDSGGKKYWTEELAKVKTEDKNRKRQEIVSYFYQVAATENNKNQKVEFGDLLNKNDKGRVLFVQPQSAGDVLLCTALFKSIKERYPDWALYVSTNKEYKSIIDGNKYVDKWIEFQPVFENIHFLEGNSANKGYFDIVYSPYWQTQKLINPTRNGLDKIHFDIKYD